ncbi:MAG: cobalamin biosynthesis protein CobD [Gemmatimonadetes bacterium]|nr:cobalamin biosynthesis protein CobD [Gemmatimonadota bacterium]
MSRRGIAGLALAADLLLGEPPAPLHPTVWMGRWLRGARERRRSRAPLASLAEGAAGVLAGAALAAGAAHLVGRQTDRFPRPLPALALGAALKPALALRALLDAGREVEVALLRDDLSEARRLLAWHLVSRDTSELSAAEVAGAAIESLAENLGDGLVAPLLAWRAGGLPAAYLYRLVNTADAMLGYRTPELEWFGKFAARADDALNRAPARLAALAVALAAPLGEGDGRAALRLALRDAGRTASPNAGWPMAAMAGALGVRLRKRGAYDLHPEGREPGPGDLRRARRIVAGAGILAAVAASV